MPTLKKTVCFIWIMLIFLLPAAFANTLDAVFLDVGMSDCALIICDGEAMMVDTGFTNADWEHIQEVMSSNGVNTLKYLVLTHPQADHIGNARVWLSRIMWGMYCFRPSSTTRRRLTR